MTDPSQQETSNKASNNGANTGNNSDDSNQFSIGNNSFGFNFDSDEVNPSPVNSDGGFKEDNGRDSKNTAASTTDQATTDSSNTKTQDKAKPAETASAPDKPTSKQGVKRKSSIDTSNGYKSDDESSPAPPINAAPSQVISSANPSVLPSTTSSSDAYPDEHSSKKGKKLDDIKREERNQREKERSYRITSQINELRTLLSAGGVIVPKGTKNAVLTEAANYIRDLQQRQYNSEIHRQQLIQQMQMIGSGQLGQQAANAIRHVAAQNGVWSLGNFGGMPPRSAMRSGSGEGVPSAVGQTTNISNASSDQSSNTGSNNGSSSSSPPAANNQLIKDIEDHDYRFVFNSCAIGMAIASMGGAFIDCNQLFIQLSEYSKQEICGLTIFNLTARDDLQNAFDLISQMISPPADAATNLAPSCVLRGNMKNRNDIGLNITLIKDEQGIAKCFCVTLIRNPSSCYDTNPIHATADMIRSPEDQKKQENMESPAYTAG